MVWKLVLERTVAAFAFAAAGFWFMSARLDIPSPIAYFDYTPDDDPFVMAMRKSATLNKKAALCAAASAIAAALLAGGDVGAAWLSIP